MVQKQSKQQTQLKEGEDTLQMLFAGYGGDELPLAQYAALVGVYGAAFALFLVATKSASRPQAERIGLADMLLLGVATYKLSRLIAKDRVTAPLRAPFVEYEDSAGTSELKERPRGQGWQRAFGDLLTCPYCIGAWVAAALTYGFVFSSRTTRIIGGIMTTTALSDALNLADDWAKKAAQEAK